MAVVGPVETVFDWSADRCATDDIPDLPARAFRDSGGKVQLISSHIQTRRMIGPTLDTLARDCTVRMRSDHNPDPAQFDDSEWLAAPYTEDGSIIYALVHMEYHGWEHSTDCQPPNHFPCWYNSITLASSTDAGASYADAADPPNQLVASLPDRYQAGAGPYGVLEPSNIVKKDGYYYDFVRIDETNSDQQRICLMRTDDLSTAGSWRFWDGEGFNVQMGDPYALPNSALGGVPCAPISPDTLGVMEQSVTFNTYLNRYVMVGTTAIHLGGARSLGRPLLDIGRSDPLGSAPVAVRGQTAMDVATRRRGLHALSIPVGSEQHLAQFRNFWQDRLRLFHALQPAPGPTARQGPGSRAGRVLRYRQPSAGRCRSLCDSALGSLGESRRPIRSGRLPMGVEFRLP